MNKENAKLLGGAALAERWMHYGDAWLFQQRIAGCMNKATASFAEKHIRYEFGDEEADRFLEVARTVLMNKDPHAREYPIVESKITLNVAKYCEPRDADRVVVHHMHDHLIIRFDNEPVKKTQIKDLKVRGKEL